VARRSACRALQIHFPAQAMKEAASEARKQAMLANSSAVPIRSTRMLALILTMNFSNGTFCRCAR
jgi:hypothetical protein